VRDMNQEAARGQTPCIVRNKPNFGVMLGNATKDLALASGIDGEGGDCCTEGVYVKRVVPKSPADKAGISPGDIICKFEGFEIDSNGEARVPWNSQKVSISVLIHRANDLQKKYSFQIARNGECATISIAPSTSFIQGGMRFLWPPQEPYEYLAMGGIVMMDLCGNHIEDSDKVSDAYRELAWTEKNVPRVVVVDVVEGSLARRKKGLDRGNFVHSVNGFRVSSLADIREALRAPVRGEFVLWKCENGTKYAESVRDILRFEREVAQPQRLYDQETEILDVVSAKEDSLSTDTTDRLQHPLRLSDLDGMGSS